MWLQYDGEAERLRAPGGGPAGISANLPLAVAVALLAALTVACTEAAPGAAKTGQHSHRQEKVVTLAADKWRGCATIRNAATGRNEIPPGASQDLGTVPEGALPQAWYVADAVPGGWVALPFRAGDLGYSIVQATDKVTLIVWYHDLLSFTSEAACRSFWAEPGILPVGKVKLVWHE